MYSKGLLLLIITLCSSGCASVSSGDLRQYLDENTAVVVTGLSKPLVLQRDRSQLGANAKDNIHAGPIEINHSGQYTYYLWLGIWSTIDDPATQAGRDGFKTIYVLIDGEPIELQLTAWNFIKTDSMLGLYDKPVGSASDAIYAVTVDQLSRVAGAGRLQLVTNTAVGQTYDTQDWNGQGMASFVAYARGETPQ